MCDLNSVARHTEEGTVLKGLTTFTPCGVRARHAYNPPISTAKPDPSKLISKAQRMGISLEPSDFSE